MTGFNNWHLVVGHPRAGRWVCKTEVAQNTSRHCVYLQTLRNTSILGLFYSSHFIFILVRETYFGSALPISLEVTAWLLGWVSWSCLKIGDISVVCVYIYILILFCVCCCWPIRDNIFQCCSYFFHPPYYILLLRNGLLYASITSALSTWDLRPAIFLIAVVGLRSMG